MQIKWGGNLLFSFSLLVCLFWYLVVIIRLQMTRPAMRGSAASYDLFPSGLNIYKQSSEGEGAESVWFLIREEQKKKKEKKRKKKKEKELASNDE